MSHQPYETFLFSDQILGPEQQQSLNAHLKECQHCSALAAALTGLDEALAHSPSLQPVPGFTLRWQTHLSAYRQKRQVRNLWLMTLGLFTLAGLTVLSIALANLYHLNWAYVFSQSVARFSLVAAQVRQCANFLRTFTTALPITVPIMVLFGSGAFFALGALVITWFSTIIRLYSPIVESDNIS